LGVLRRKRRGIHPEEIDHEWMMKFIEHRISDKRVLRHVKKWLNAGVLEDGKVTQAEYGTPQGGSTTPPTILQNWE
jgi:retron-type reverse transcriptase